MQMKTTVTFLLFVFCAFNSTAQTDSMTLSPNLLKSAFGSSTDTVDYFDVTTSTQIVFLPRLSKSVYLLDADTVLSPDHGDELDICYRDTASAAAAYEGLLRYASARDNRFYSMAKSGLYCGRSGDLIVVVWHTHDMSRFDDTGERRYFKSRQFLESFEVRGKVRQLRKRLTSADKS